MVGSRGAPARKVVLVACVLSFVAAPAAGAGTIQSDGTHVGFTAGVGEANHLLILQAPDGYRAVDLGAALTPGAGCSAVSANEVFCTVGSDEAAQVDVAAGDLNDFVSVTGTEVAVTLNGEDGDDVLEVVASCEFLCPFGVANALHGGAGDDTLRGGPGGTNFLDGGADSDTMSGGIGDYSARTNPIVADADGMADDGESGEGDNLDPSVYFILGGSGNDDITAGAAGGGAGNDTLTVSPGSSGFLFGGSGDDVLVGRSRFDDLEGGVGNDTLSGGASSDYLSGGRGDDTLRGDDGPDSILGNQGNDWLSGGLGRDDLFGGLGNDTIRSRDGLRDYVDGNAGTDRARVDRGLDLVRNVERFF
jgi:Ca2+-binding RTX toxin-like protein